MIRERLAAQRANGKRSTDAPRAAHIDSPASGVGDGWEPLDCRLLGGAPAGRQSGNPVIVFTDDLEGLCGADIRPVLGLPNEAAIGSFR